MHRPSAGACQFQGMRARERAIQAARRGAIDARCACASDGAQGRTGLPLVRVQQRDDLAPLLLRARARAARGGSAF